MSCCPQNEYQNPSRGLLLLVEHFSTQELDVFSNTRIVGFKNGARCDRRFPRLQRG